MYGYITGKVVDITPKDIIIDNNNIGYQIIVPNPYSFKINEYFKVYTYQHVREDEITLYGFMEKEEKELFLKLISVSGIGPKSALSMLATGNVREIVGAIEARNDTYLRKFPGIGPKASQQIILDLKGKVNFNSNYIITSNKLEDVSEALVALGYKKAEISKIISKLDDSLDEGTLVKMALKLLTK